MSKAFTSEENEPEPIRRRTAIDVKPGAVRYITSDGYQKLRDELANLAEVVRPQIIAKGSQGESLSGVDHRIALITALLPHLTVAEVSKDPHAVGFGSWVTLEAEDGEKRYRIVGIDEADAKAHMISAESPLARALLGKRIGDAVEVEVPAGVRMFAIVRIGENGK